MIEAMACGTPVIAYRSGSVPEVIDEGVSGYIVESIDESVAAVARLGELDRQAVRARFEQRFTAERMTRNYVELYGELVAEGTVERASPSFTVLGADVAHSADAEARTFEDREPAGSA
jgi:hypothetical protein